MVVNLTSVAGAHYVAGRAVRRSTDLAPKGRRGERLSATAVADLGKFVRGSAAAGSRLSDAIAGLAPLPKSGSWNVDNFSPFLAAYRTEAGRSVIEVPGQYTGLARPSPTDHVVVVSVEPALLIMSSMRKPKRLTLNGSDGRDYKFLVKVGASHPALPPCRPPMWRLTRVPLSAKTTCGTGEQGGEDLRLDQRVQQMFEVTNGLLRREGEAQLTTYRVRAGTDGRARPAAAACLRNSAAGPGLAWRDTLTGIRSWHCHCRSACSSGSTTRRR